jgi:hypothetical protein
MQLWVLVESTFSMCMMIWVGVFGMLTRCATSSCMPLLCLTCWLLPAYVLFTLLQPDSGRLEAYRPPGGPGIRLDSAVTAGNVISRYYDSLLSKVIASAPTFDKAVQRMARALQEFQVRTTTGVPL